MPFWPTPELDAVSICTPSGAHLQPALAAVAAGKHLFIEKPLEVSLQRCQRIISAADAAGVVCAGVFQSRSLPDVLLIKRALQQGRFGSVVVGDAIVKWSRPPSYYQDSWHGTRALDGGGALMNQSIHTIDPAAVAARPGRVGAGVHDAPRPCRARGGGHRRGGDPLRLGGAGHDPGVDRHPPRLRTADRDRRHRRQRRPGRRHAARSGCSRTRPKRMRRSVRAAPNPIPASAAPRIRPASASPVTQRQYQEVVSAIEEGRQPDIDGRAAMAAVAIVLAIYESARSGRPVAPEAPSAWNRRTEEGHADRVGERPVG